MQHFKWHTLLIVGVLFLPATTGAQEPKQVPAATVRELATVDGNIGYFVRIPNGRALIYSQNDSTFAYDIGTKLRTLLGTDMRPASVSPQGDRFAFSRSSEDRTGRFLWTMPIDPMTGIATGSAHRVSLRPTDGSQHARFSPDGKLLAFNAGPRPDGTWDVALVPAAGGAERIVVNYPVAAAALAWSADGKFLDVETERNPAIERIPVVGGRSEPLFPLTPVTGYLVVGLSPDARVALFQSNPDRFFYRTAAGVEGEIPVALPPLDGGWGFDFSLDSMRYLTMTRVVHSSVRTLNIATGQAREVLPGNESTSAPAWSPDGRRLAVLIGNLSHYEIAIMNPDGSGLRRYPLPKDLNGWGEPWGGRRGMPWSPDGRYLAFRARSRSEVGRHEVGWNEVERLLVLLDVASGETRVLSRATMRMESFVWRSDGKAIRVLKATEEQSAPARWSIAEVPLNGPERQLRDISGEFPRPYNVVFVTDREVALATSADKKTWYVVPLDGGAARRLPDAGTADPGLRLGLGVVTGNRLMIAQVDGIVNEAKAITILSLRNDITRTLRPPFASANHGVLPDDKHFLLVKKGTDKSESQLFLVPLDGSAPRLIGTMSGGTGGVMAASPDGKLLAYTSEGRYTSKLLEIDFSAPLQALMKP